MAYRLLDSIYAPGQVFIVGHSFNDVDISVDLTCFVPSETGYAAKPIPYVTAENYVRCLSQASYLLSEHILETGLISLDITVEKFREAAIGYDLYYRNLSMVFHQRVQRDKEFRMVLVLKNWKEIKRVNDFILFVFSNPRTVISGEMSFVFKGD